MEDSSYVNVGTIRWVMDILDEERILVLDDGSQWELDATGPDADVQWKKTMLVMIETRGVPVGGYVLSASDGRRIPVGFLGVASWSDESPQPV